MLKCAVLVGSAPENYRQKKLDDTWNYLESEEGGSFQPGGIVSFANGITELMLENVLNNVIDQEADEARLYFFAQNESDLSALSEYEAVGYGKLEVVKVGGEEIRKEIIDYYKDLFEKVGSSLQVFYEVAPELVSDEDAGFEKV